MISRGIATTDSVASADMAVFRAARRNHAGRTAKAVRTVITVICHLGDVDTRHKTVG
jgi:hypothetical protein